jgi:anti-sigma B factor antagonist
MADPRCPFVMIGGVPVVDAPLDIDAANAEGFQKILLRAASCRQATVVVNMTGTRFCDSAGVRVLVRAHERAVTKGGQLLLVIPSSAVLRVFALTGIARVIPHFADLNEALEQAQAVVPRPLQRRAVPPLAYRMSNRPAHAGAGITRPAALGPAGHHLMTSRPTSLQQPAPGRSGSSSTTRSPG